MPVLLPFVDQCEGRIFRQRAIGELAEVQHQCRSVEYILM
jgi:hypothetical protein